MSEWRGFYKESVSYISPKKLIEWIKFIFTLPIAYIKFKYYSRNDK